VKILDWIDRAAVVISVSALCTMVVLVCVSVTGRYLFAAPIPDDLVFSEFLMVFIVFLPFSSVQAAREHVFVTIFTEWMSNEKKVLFETFGVFVGLIGFSIVCAAVFTDFQESWEYQSYVDGPLELREWPAKFAVFFGVALFCMRLLVDLIQSVHGIATGTAQATQSEEDRVLDTEF
jgi:TRAP-type C4-dicarboxylate transport system permease small subunit|tara:strand:- start:2636 stop:3166 length:531 start_codon:yes stop_codon:yes gene_type:complete